MSNARILVTGGSGFIGSGLVKALLRAGCRVRVLDDNSRGSPRRLSEVANDIEFIAGDIRDAAAVESAARGMDEVHHLAFVNGTEFFYNAPDLVLDVGVRGMINVIDACRKQNVGTLMLASSSEVYQTPPKIPTDESAPLVVPDVQNPRYSYGAGKLISEVMAINFGRKYFERVLIFRPHNVYGPDMGWEHVVPQFALRLQAAAKRQPSGRLRFEIQGTGAGDAQLLLRRRPGRRRHGDAREGRASRHLSHRHQRRDDHRGPGAAHRRPCRPRDRTRRRQARGRRHRPALSRHFETRTDWAISRACRSTKA